MKVAFTALSFFFLVILCFVFLLFKTEVSMLEKDIAKLNDSIDEDRMTIHVLNAELAHLNEPARIRALVQKHMKLKEVSAEQIKGIDIFSEKKQNFKKVSY